MREVVEAGQGGVSVGYGDVERWILFSPFHDSPFNLQAIPPDSEASQNYVMPTSHQIRFGQTNKIYLL